MKTQNSVQTKKTVQLRCTITRKVDGVVVESLDLTYDENTPWPTVKAHQELYNLARRDSQLLNKKKYKREVVAVENNSLQ